MSLKTLYEYNQLNKLTKVTYADGKTVELSYDPLKQLKEMKDWLGITTIETDALGRAEKITDFEGKTIQYEWDELNRKQKITYPDLSEVKYTYNRSSRLSSVISACGETQYRYDAMGRITEKTLPNGIATSYEFNPLGHIESLTHSQGQDILDKFKYNYDPAGNITQINKHRQGLEADSGAFNYSYDPLGRLVSATNGAKTKEYIYDNLGNRLGSMENGRAIKHQYNALNQLISTKDGQNEENYRYDKRGNLTEVLKNGQLKANYTFDATNMMTQAFNSEKGTAKYTYDGFRNRVKRLEQIGNSGIMQENELQKTDPMNEVRYILDMTRPYNNLLMTEGDKTQRYIWGNELLEAEGADPFYYLQDHLGSPIRLVDGNSDGNSSANSTPLSYDEFGVPLVEAAAEAGSRLYNPFGFTGYQRDNISELYYAQARYYEPLAGRFVSEDILRDNINWYNYCGGNPMAFIDPSGNTACEFEHKSNWNKWWGGVGDGFVQFYKDLYAGAKGFWNDPLGTIENKIPDLLDPQTYIDHVLNAFHFAVSPYNQLFCSMYGSMIEKTLWNDYYMAESFANGDPHGAGGIYGGMVGEASFEAAVIGITYGTGEAI